MSFFTLPSDVIVCTLDFIGLEDLQNLDFSVSSVIDRKVLFDCYQNIDRSTIERSESLWICFRKNNLLNISVDGLQNGSHYNSGKSADVLMRKLLMYSTSVTKLSVYNSYYKLNNLVALESVSLKKLQYLRLQNVSGSFTNPFLIDLVSFCPCLEVIDIVLCKCTVNAKGLAKAFDLSPYFESFRYETEYGNIMIEVSILEQRLSLDYCCDRKMYQIIDFVAAFPRDTFKTLNFGYLDFSHGYASKLFQSIEEQCPNLHTIGLGSPHANTASYIKNLLRRVPSITKFGLWAFRIKTPLFGTFFAEPLPNNVTTIEFYTRNSNIASLATQVVQRNQHITIVELYTQRDTNLSVLKSFVNDLINMGRIIVLDVKILQ